jgi:hypothetical protein
MNTPRIAAGSYTNATKVDQMKYREANREALRERKKLWRKERKLLCAAAIPTDLKHEETDRACVVCGARIRNINPKTTTCDPICTKARNNGLKRHEQFWATEGM